MKANQPNERIIALLNEARPKSIPEIILNATEGANLEKLGSFFLMLSMKLDEISSQIQKGDFPEGKENKNLEALLSDFNLEAFREDFKALDSIIQALQKDFIQHSGFLMELKEASASKLKELIQALQFFNQKRQIKATFKDMQKLKSVTIQNQDLINIILEALIRQLFNHLANYQIKIQPEEIQDWGQFLSWLEEESNPSKKGRPEKEMISGFLIDLLQKYLQRHTEIKADLGIELSRRQASFIGQYLSSIGIIEADNLAWLEDNIRHTFNNFSRKAKSK